SALFGLTSCRRSRVRVLAGGLAGAFGLGLGSAARRSCGGSGAVGGAVGSRRLVRIGFLAGTGFLWDGGGFARISFRRVRRIGRVRGWFFLLFLCSRVALRLV